MTDKQSTTLVKNPNTKKAMAILTKFAKIEADYRAAEEQAKMATEHIKEAMIAGDVSKITVDVPGWEGYITLAERINYRAEDIDSVADKFTKRALDSNKIKAQAVLTGQLPVGVTESKTQYITKKFKAVE